MNERRGSLGGSAVLESGERDAVVSSMTFQQWPFRYFSISGDLSDLISGLRHRSQELLNSTAPESSRLLGSRFAAAGTLFAVLWNLGHSVQMTVLTASRDWAVNP